MAQSFKVGDIVQLKSGGPKMTVDEIRVPFNQSEPDIHCVWFAGSKRERAAFSPDTLVFAPDDKPKK
jgi:uncharacterized protein YodC (DUF2158 family)